MFLNNVDEIPPLELKLSTMPLAPAETSHDGKVFLLTLYGMPLPTIRKVSLIKAVLGNNFSSPLDNGASKLFS